MLIEDPRLVVKTVARTPWPQQVIYTALHTDYSAKYIGLDPTPEESECGDIAIKRLLKGKKHHYGPLEHPSITFSTGFFPHSVMQQARTHRVAVSFDCMSFRYTSESILKAASNFDATAIEDAFYLRPPGAYTDRKGHKYEYTVTDREVDLWVCHEAAIRYSNKIKCGWAEEHARGLLPFDYRQHFVVSFTMRSLWHFLCVRGNADAQLEIRQLCDMMLEEATPCAPELFAWFKDNLYTKKVMAP
jgi:thymidylate synthase (FAD)